MKIDKKRLEMFHWFEDSDGNIYDATSDQLPSDVDYFTYHLAEPNVYCEPVDSYTYHPEHLHENNQFYQAMLQFRWFYKLMLKRMKKRKATMTFKPMFTSSVHYSKSSEKVILAMANSGDYTLGEAIYVYCKSCERCMNVLTYKYLNGEDGYAEYSDEWYKCNTVCDWCKDDVKLEPKLNGAKAIEFPKYEEK